MSIRKGRSLQTPGEDASRPDAPPERAPEDVESEADEFEDLYGDLLWVLGLLAFIAIVLATLTLPELLRAVRMLVQD